MCRALDLLPYAICPGEIDATGKPLRRVHTARPMSDSGVEAHEAPRRFLVAGNHKCVRTHAAAQ